MYVTFGEKSCLPTKLEESVGKLQESGEGVWYPRFPQIQFAFIKIDKR